ncbi:hypothetical protein AWB65_06369 [Caballeronia humi]|uniref:Uncharacterized protein n=1 Tax=Caballeronia humi TaxID=326474 RepID=A0A158JCR3_9BURK|nr:hypothetical protein AWB65_06369 [Caballeronia humi]
MSRMASSVAALSEAVRVYRDVFAFHEMLDVQPWPKRWTLNLCRM